MNLLHNKPILDLTFGFLGRYAQSRQCAGPAYGQRVLKDNKSSPISAPRPSDENPSHRILLVEKEPSIRDVSAAVLRRHGYMVDTAENAELGWEAIQSQNYHLMITGQNLPELSGRELVEKLRSEAMSPEVIVVVEKSATDEFDRQAWLPPITILLKPFTVENLLGTVKNALSAPADTSSAEKNHSQATTVCIGQ